MRRATTLTILLLLACATAFVLWRIATRPTADRDQPVALDEPSPADVLLVEELSSLQARHEQLNQTVWAKEILAQQHGALFESLWDTLNRASEKLAVLSRFPFNELVPFTPRAPKSLPHDIQLRLPAPPAQPWGTERWQTFISELIAAGWILQRVEFRHNRFESTPDRRPKQSVFYFSADLENSRLQQRATLEGDLGVQWDPSAADTPTVHRIDASNLQLKTRRGQPPFVRVYERQVRPPKNSYFIDPLIVYDLDQDSFPEILLPASNQLLRLQPDGNYDAEPLTRQDLGLIFTAILADFTGDGSPDLLCAKFEGLVLFEGSTTGSFNQPPQLAWKANPRLKYGQALSCGDVDADGDLDVWLGQYKVPYERGQMPTPFFDANDGYPQFLLRNNGAGKFSDITVQAGLEPKRNRRVYSGSLVDLDSDGDLDLMVVSDFAGLDLYRNNAHGQFDDVTNEWLDERHAFGMAHALTDFNADGRIDLLMIGMNSPTADRLDAAGLGHPEFPTYTAMRPKMIAGNRLYLHQPAPPFFRQTSLAQSIARSGWSWGCGAGDFDNDRYPDVYIANGHETRQSVRDYEPEFWLHDIYVGTSRENIVATAYFSSKFGATRGEGFSYGGYEQNKLYFNLGGTEFLEAAYLMGVALEADSRNVLSEDLDGDGKLDLLVTTFEIWPEVKQTLQIFHNRLPDTQNWIALQFHDHSKTGSPIGAQVSLRAGSVQLTRQLVTGDSYRSQHSPTIHFGIGKLTAVDQIDVRWPDGRTSSLTNPAINRTHLPVVETRSR